MDSMPDSIGPTLDSAGWQLDVDPDSGELHLEHDDSGRSYVLGADGGIRVPGSDDVGAELRALQAALEPPQEEGSASQQGELLDSPEEVLEARAGVDAQAETSSETCTVACDEETGEATIRGATAITVRSPVVDVSARKRVDVSSVGGVNVTSEDRFEEDS
jgi:hypothetical protein